jgi:predicted enzyme related to lactoylglutathione lyase
VEQVNMAMSAPIGCRLGLALVAYVAALGSLAAPSGCTSVSPADTSAMSFTSEPLVGKVVWNDLITEDLEAARQFYGGLFGWTFDRSTTPDGGPYLLARSGRIYVAGMVQLQSHPVGTTESRWLPYVSVADVDGSVATAAASGATVAIPARNVPMGRVAVIVDREGAVIGLARSRIGDPDDTTTASAAGRIVWTELLANDPASATKFYVAVVGYVARVVERSGGGQYTFLTHQDRDRAGILKNPSNRAAPVWLTYIGVDDPLMAAKRAETLGGQVILWPSAQLRQGTMAVITDSTGALLVLRKSGA